MKDYFKRCWVYRMYAFAAVLMISFTMPAPNQDRSSNGCSDELDLGRFEEQKKCQCVSCPQQQISEENFLISTPNKSGLKMPNAHDANSADSNKRHDPPLLGTQLPITVGYCVTGYSPTSDSGMADSIIAANYIGIQPSGFYPRDKLYEYSEAIYIAGELRIDKYIKEVVSIPNYQREIYPFII